MIEFLKRSSKALGVFFCAVVAALAVSLVVPMDNASVGTTAVVEAKTKISKTSISMPIGATYKLKVSGASKVTWTSSNSKIAKVKSNGKVTAKKAGKVTITAKVGKKSYSCKVEVLGFSLNQTDVTMTKGKTTKIKVSGTKSKVTYKTYNKKVATVSSKGVVKAVKKGSTSIKVKVGKQSYIVPVKVETPSISKSSISVNKGSTYRLKVNGTSRSVSWSSNNKSVATVNSTGKVTAKGKGQAVITAKLNDVSYSCKVSVGGKSVIVCPDNVTIKYGETKKVTLTAGDSFSYGSENSNLVSAEINPSSFHTGDKLTMTLTGKAVGTTYIVFKSNAGWTKKCKVTVTGTAVSTGTVSNTINDIKVNGIKAYRSCDTKNPEIYVESSVTSNINVKVNYMYVTYGLYNKSGKLLYAGDELVNAPVKGKVNTINFKLMNTSNYNVNDITTIKILDIDVRLDSSVEGKEIPNFKPTIATNSGNTGIQFSNISAKFCYNYMYCVTDAHLTYKVTNTTNSPKTVAVYYDVYDQNGKLIPQASYCYDSQSVGAKQTATMSTDSISQELVGQVSNGRFSKIVLRAVLY